MSESYDQPAPKRPKDPAPPPAPKPTDTRVEAAADAPGDGGLSPALESEGGGPNRRGQGRSDIQRP
jgi:hypothetical protein